MVQQDRPLLMQVIDSGLIFICSFVTVVVFTLTEMGGAASAYCTWSLQVLPSVR